MVWAKFRSRRHQTCPLLLQAVLEKAQKASALAEMEENDPDAADDDDEDDTGVKDDKSNSLIDSVTNILQKTGLTS